MSEALQAKVEAAFVGDVALGGEYLRRAQPRGKALTYPFEPLEELLAPTRLLIINLEGPFGTDGTPRPGRSALLFNHVELLGWLGRFPNVVCSLANNHTMDYGAEALSRTIDLLEARGIRHVGGGANEEQATAPLVLTVDGLRIGFLAFTTDELHVGSVLAAGDESGSCGLPEPEVACRQVAELAAQTDCVVVLLHAGYEYFNYPHPSQVAFSRELVASGATLVVGHHPHVQQGVENIGNSVVCHSLGNLLLPEMRSTSGRIQYRKPVTKQFAVLNATLGAGQIESWALTGGRCDRQFNLIPYAGEKARRFAASINDLSQPLKRRDYGDFWNSYRVNRTRALQREGLRDAVAKLFKSDFKTIWRTLSAADLKRNLRRLFPSGARRSSCAGPHSGSDQNS